MSHLRRLSRRFLPFREAREYVRPIGISSWADYSRWAATEKPSFIPTRPDTCYKHHGFLNLADFCGFEPYHRRESSDSDLDVDGIYNDPRCREFRTRLQFHADATEFAVKWVREAGFDVMRLPLPCLASLLYRPRSEDARTSCSSAANVHQWCPLGVKTTRATEGTSLCFQRMHQHLEMGVLCVHLPSKDSAHDSRVFLVDGNDFRGRDKFWVRVAGDSTQSQIISEFNTPQAAISQLTAYHNRYGSSSLSFVSQLQRLLTPVSCGSTAYRRICYLYEHLYHPAGLTFEVAPQQEISFNTLIGGRRIAHRSATPCHACYRLPLRTSIGHGLDRPFRTSQATMDFVVSMITTPGTQSSVAGVFVFPRKIIEHCFAKSSCASDHEEVEDTDGTRGHIRGGKQFLAVYPPWSNPRTARTRKFQEEQSQYFIDLRDDSLQTRERNVARLLEILSKN